MLMCCYPYTVFFYRVCYCFYLHEVVNFREFDSDYKLAGAFGTDYYLFVPVVVFVELWLMLNLGLLNHGDLELALV